MAREEGFGINLCYRASMLVSTQRQSPYKFGNGAAEDEPCVYENVWETESDTGVQRLTIAPDGNHIKLLQNLLDALPEPMWLLYVLVVPRGEEDAGRYQSPIPLSRNNVKEFLSNFGDLLEKDGRQNLWIRSAFEEAMVVYDRHNLLYAYGRMPELISILRRDGLKEVQSGSIAVPSPHSHHYHASFDGEEMRLLNSFEWHWTPLQEQDQR